ncbi:MAG: Smr/MutS family protein [Flavobacteriales bacterium]|nr:Smr/MutS family protein [Flavobacteriales bacterium]
MKLRVGELIFVTDEDLKGLVTCFNERDVTFTCDDGFDYTFPLEKVFRINEEGNAESSTRKRKIELTTIHVKKEKQDVVYLNVQDRVIDLHLEVLIPSKQFLNDFEALSFQLDVVREVIFQANRKRIRKLTLVHGIGKGKLRKELRNLLDNSYPEIEYLDGNYQKYGGGATDIIIHQFDS